jgi:hypothetical protein
MGRGRGLLLAAAMAACGACAMVTPSSSGIPLPLAAFPNACRGIGIDGTLHGDAADPRVAWLVVDGTRNELVWPPGYTARFDPSLTVVDSDGRPVFQDGDRVSGACLSGSIGNVRVLRLTPFDRVQ